MKKATSLSIAVTTVFYLLCGCMAYAAFGDTAPGNLLTGFGFYNPYWLLDIANIAIVVHLVGAYQVITYQRSDFYVVFSSKQLTSIGNCRCIASPYLHLLRNGAQGSGQRVTLLLQNTTCPSLSMVFTS